MNKRSGFILLAVSMVLAVLAVLTYSLGKMGGLSARTAARSVDAERARLLAEAGLAHALRNMQIPSAAAMSGPTACSFNSSFTLGAAGTTTAYLSGGIHGVGTYAVGFFRQAVDTANGARPLLLEAVGTLANGAQHRLRLPLPTQSFALPGWSSSRAIAATVAVANDTFIRSDDEWDNFSWKDEVEIDGPGDREERVLLRFGLSGFPGLASNSRTLYVRLGLYQSLAGTSANTLTAHLITQDWNIDDATWRKRTSDNNWSTHGGTHNASALGSMAFISGTGMRWMELDASIVGAWQAANRGLLLKASENTAFRFYSLNYNHWTNNDSTFQMRVPKLEIVYLKGC